MIRHHRPTRLTKPAAALLCALAAAPTPLAAAELALLPPPLAVNERLAADRASGLALDGLDPVTYWLPGGPVPGRPAFEVIWRGLLWRFTGPANRAAFLREPESYGPRFGGYDASTAAAGGIAEPDPRVFLVRDGRLYLFRTEASRARFDDAAARVAEERWPELSAVLARR